MEVDCPVEATWRVNMDLGLIVLAGGKNLRLGRNKALEPLNDETLIERTIRRVRPLVKEVLVVTSEERFPLPLVNEITQIKDIYAGKGPLGGIYSGLFTSNYSQNIVVACDMPFLNMELFRYMVTLSGNFDAVVPSLGQEMLEPLHAVYSRNCLNSMKACLEHGRLGVNSFIRTLNVRYVEREECCRLDPELLSFFNINRQSDLDRASELIARQRMLR
jgi:molybdopterin-guanine dinucleotide biosynthesis protein A